MFLSPRYCVARRHPDGIPGEPQEVHSWNQNDLRWHQEEGRAPGPHRIPQICDIMNEPHKSEYLMLFYYIYVLFIFRLAHAKLKDFMFSHLHTRLICVVGCLESG